MLVFFYLTLLNPNMSGNHPLQPSYLLNMAVTATAQTDSSGSANPLSAIDPERRIWLEQALSSAFSGSDVAKEMKMYLDLLSELDMDELHMLNALEILKDLTEHIDFSNDFHKIGGYPVLKNLLWDSRPKLRSSAAELLGQLLQNNPYCQQMALDEDFFPILLELMEKDPSQEVRNKILGAVSSLVRSNREAQAKFCTLGGLSSLIRSLTATDDVKFQTKAAFMLNSICRENSTVGVDLGNMGITHHFASLLQTDHSQLHEQVLEALLYVLKHSDIARQEARQPQLNISGSMTKLKAVLTDQEQFKEELELIAQIEQILGIGRFATQDPEFLLCASR